MVQNNSDHAVAEVTYKTLRTEFIRNQELCTFEELKLEFDNYIHRYNNYRIHEISNYTTQKTYKLKHP